MLFTHLKLTMSFTFIWLCFNCELLSNPKWSFGWPPTLFVWMGRRRAWLVA